MQQNVQAQQLATTASSVSTTHRVQTYDQPSSVASNGSNNDHHVQKKAIIAEKEKIVFRCPDCSKSFKHASGNKM